MSKGNVMTLEQKLYAMRMIDLAEYAEARGIKINKKGAKAKAVEKILAVENDKWEEEAKKEKEVQEKLQAEKDKVAEDAMNKKKSKSVQTPKATASAKKTEKSKAKRTNLRLTTLTYNGETKSIKDWAAEIGMPTPTLYDRVNRNGWTVEEAIETPLGQRRSK